MKAKTMTSMERVLTALSHREPDRVPMFLLTTMHGARELGVSLREYFSNSDLVVEGQLRMLKKYSNDCIYSFFYAPIEVEAFGSEVIWSDDGPANSGLPILTSPELIRNLQPPRIRESRSLLKVLDATRKLKEAVKDTVPIIGVVMSPFSLPVMQLGFDKYLDLMFFHKDLFDKLMLINEEFCVEWANAQLASGATAICYFDPVSSSTIITREQYLDSGFKVAKKTISRIAGPTATHFASGKCLTILDDVSQTGTAVVGVSSEENIGDLKEACRGKLTVLGNLNGIEMRRWTESDAEQIVKSTISQAAPGGGFILGDNHGEIPFQVPEKTLLAISEAVREFGQYPIKQE
jgi:uroporphyrinogen decarboxylase